VEPVRPEHLRLRSLDASSGALLDAVRLHDAGRLRDAENETENEEDPRRRLEAEGRGVARRAP
jgi:hypothetical protein